MKALILENKVVDIAAEEFPVAEPLTWVDCPDNCASGWTYDGTNFTVPIVTVDYVAEAKAALNKSDSVALRCLKAGVAFPAAWQAYVTTARANVNGATNTLTQPSYPEGT